MAEEAGSAKLGEAHIEVRARTDKLNKDLDQTKQKADVATTVMKKGFNDVEEHVTFATRALFGLRGTIGTIIAIPLIQEAVSKFRDMADEIEDIGVKAKTIGLTTDQLQELSYAARQADVSAEELNTSLSFFAKGFGQAQAGVGPLVEGLKKIDPELAKALKGARNMQEALFIVADAMDSLTSTTDKAAVSTAVFGRSGIGNLRLFGEGSAKLREAAAAARDLGQVLSSDQIEKGGELSDAFTEAAAAINISFKKALIEAAPALIKFIELVASATKFLNELAGGVSRMDSATASSLADTFKTLKGELDDIDTRLSSPDLKFEGKTIEEALRKRRDLIVTSLGETQQEIERLEQAALDSSAKGDKETSTHFKPGRKLVPVISDEDLKKSADERKAAQDQLRDFNIRYLQETKQVTAAIQAEHDKELAKFQEMLDKKLISEDQFIEARAKLADLTAKKMAEAFEQEFKSVLEAGQAVASGLESAFRQWAETGEFNAKKMINSILADLATLSFKQGVLQPLFGGGDKPGGGLFGDLLKGIFGGGGNGGWETSTVKLHGGGRVGSAGRWSMGNPALWANAPRFHDGLMPGEYRAILKRGEMVIPDGAGFGGGSVTLNIDARGSEIGVEQKIRREVMAGLAAARPQMIKDSVAAVGKTRATRPGYLRT